LNLSVNTSRPIFFKGIYEQSSKNEFTNVTIYKRSRKRTDGAQSGFDDDDDEDAFDEPQSRLIRIDNGNYQHVIFL
jgi:hypothetical protein